MWEPGRTVHPAVGPPPPPAGPAPEEAREIPAWAAQGYPPPPPEDGTTSSSRVTTPPLGSSEGSTGQRSSETSWADGPPPALTRRVERHQARQEARRVEAQRTTTEGSPSEIQDQVAEELVEGALLEQIQEAEREIERARPDLLEGHIEDQRTRPTQI